MVTVLNKQDVGKPVVIQHLKSFVTRSLTGQSSTVTWGTFRDGEADKVSVFKDRMPAGLNKEVFCSLSHDFSKSVCIPVFVVLVRRTVLGRGVCSTRGGDTPTAPHQRGCCSPGPCSRLPWELDMVFC